MNKTIKELIKRLLEEDIIHAKTYAGAVQTVHYWIRTGKLTPRQLPHSGYYQFTDEEIEQIIKEFKVGGMGFWSYNQD